MPTPDGQALNETVPKAASGVSTPIASTTAEVKSQEVGRSPAPPSPPSRPHLLPKRIPLRWRCFIQACLGGSGVGRRCHRSELSEGIYLQALKVQGLVSVMSEILNQSFISMIKG